MNSQRPDPSHPERIGRTTGAATGSGRALRGDAGRPKDTADAKQRHFITLVKERVGPPRPTRPDDARQHDVRATLSISEAAWELGVCAETVYRRAKVGELPGAFKIGRTWRVSREPFDRWLSSR